MASIFLGQALAGQSELLVKSGQAEVGKPAPWLAGWTLDGQVLNVKKSFDDPSVKSVALIFFATWCMPCRHGIEALKANKPILDAAGVRVILVDYQETADKVRDLIAKCAIPFPVLLDVYGQSRGLFLDAADGSVALPRTVVIGRDGLVKRIIGEEKDDYINKVKDEG